MALKRTLVESTITNSKKLKSCNGLEPDFINYISVPSLESMSIVSIATVLFKQPDVEENMQKHSMKYDPVGKSVRGTLYDRSYSDIEKKIMDKIVSLPIPNVLKVKVSNIVGPIQSQILKWIRHDRKDIEFIDSIFWSNEGTIDKIKTVKHLIEKDTSNQHVESNYKFSCKFCLEENIHSLWNQLSEKAKKYYWCSKQIYKSYDNHLLAYWTHYINNDLSVLVSKIQRYDNEGVYNVNDSIYKNMFEVVLLTNNFLAVKYFWNKITSGEINSNIIHWVHLAVRRLTYGGYQTVQESTDIFHFLLSKMNSKTEQNEVLQENPRVILKSLLLNWPWQRFFLSTINLLWVYVDEKFYVTLLDYITHEINEKKSTENLFSRLWSDTPMSLKKHFLQNVLKSYRNTTLFSNLMIVGKVRIVKTILECANLKDKKQIIFSLVKHQNFVNVVHSDKLNLFDDLCVDVLSQSDIKCIKERIVREHGNEICLKWIENGESDKVDAFLNWALNAQEQIERFKSETLEKDKITFSLLYHIGNYEFADRFLSWCFGSEEQIREFKKNFVKSNPDIVKIGYDDWDLFEKFLVWCFGTDEGEVLNYRSYLSQSFKLARIIFASIAFGYKFDFIENVINWCFISLEEKKEFKARFPLSKTWLDLLQRFVSNYKCYDSEWNNWELIKKLLKLVSPLDRDLIVQLKKEIESRIDFEDFRGDYKCRSYPVSKKNLFRLLDDESYDICCSSGEDEQDVSDCERECEIVLTDVLNNVKN